MYILFILENIVIIISIFIIFIMLYKTKNIHLKSKDILFIQKYRVSPIFLFLYIISIITFILSLISSHIFGIVFSAMILMLTVSIKLKILEHYFCIYKSGVALLNGFKEIISDFPWQCIRVFSFDSKDRSKAYIVAADESGQDKVIAVHINNNDIDLFRMLMEKGFYR